ncbi:hypothetical protein BcepF1.016 [Burkholderia phage BcepF1]|uniref:Uncharacterized protein n=1 Tax=Burkholderia phage BcepF1 TaxID=2886897 RepID=A1YZS0_9CAUD|nr:hypothetical protein BcepF1.016 [Burkholderia phage BcepF1]ABL96747.1 hypothetical protein BcepF1.016 [Burkholderia phage BcepF1]
MSNRYIVKGVNDERDFCECCGKKGLKRVVWIEDTETGEIKHFGTTCAAQPVKGFGVDREIQYAIRQFDNRAKEIGRMTLFHYKKLGGKYIAHPTKEFSFVPEDSDLYAKALAEMTIEVDKFYSGFKAIK